MALKQLRVLALLVVIGTLGTLLLAACARPEPLPPQAIVAHRLQILAPMAQR